MAVSLYRHIGRPKLPGSFKTIRLRESVFDLWRRRKRSLGFDESTDSEFAEFLFLAQSQHKERMVGNVAIANILSDHSNTMPRL